MKQFSKTTIYLLFMINFHCLGQSENQSTKPSEILITPNGVVHHKCKGVENNNISPANNPTTNTYQTPVSEWNINQCVNGINDINRKIKHLKDQNAPISEIEQYQNTIMQINDRKAVLNLQISNK